MTKRKTRYSRVVEVDDAWRKRWQQAVREVEKELPWLEARNQQMADAAAEPTLSGQLRRAIRAGWRDFLEMVAALEISSEDYSDFMAGQRTLPSDVMDQMAKLLGYELVQSCELRDPDLREVRLTMPKRRIRRSRVVEMDEARRKRWEEDVRFFESERGRAEVEELGLKLAAAQREPTLSGRLRWAAHKNWRNYDEMVTELKISREEYSDWLAGEGTLTSDVIDRLAALVGCELVATEQVEKKPERIA